MCEGRVEVKGCWQNKNKQTEKTTTATTMCVCERSEGKKKVGKEEKINQNEIKGDRVVEGNRLTHLWKQNF